MLEQICVQPFLVEIGKFFKPPFQTTMLQDFNLEQEKFINENKPSGDIRVPWIGYKNEEQLKEQILQLSKDKRNFLRAPPAGFRLQTVICTKLHAKL